MSQTFEIGNIHLQGVPISIQFKLQLDLKIKILQNSQECKHIIKSVRNGISLNTGKEDTMYICININILFEIKELFKKELQYNVHMFLPQCSNLMKDLSIKHINEGNFYLEFLVKSC